MLTAAEFAAVLRGLKCLILWDSKGFTFFNATVEGFWRSFWAALMIYPIFALDLVLRYGLREHQESLLAFSALESMRYIINWLIFPLVMFRFAAVLDVQANFLRFIVAYNWFHLVSAALILPAITMALAGQPEPATFFGMIFLTATFAYTWFLLRAGLGLSISAAIALALFDFLFTEFIGALIYKALSLY